MLSCKYSSPRHIPMAELSALLPLACTRIPKCGWLGAGPGPLRWRARDVEISILSVSKSPQVSHASLGAEKWQNEISTPKVRAQSTRPLIMQRTGDSFFLPFQISGFTQRLQRGKFGTWLPWHEGVGFFCPRRLLPWKFVLIRGSTQVDPVAVSADQRLQKTSNPGQKFSISQSL